MSDLQKLRDRMHIVEVDVDRLYKTIAVRKAGTAVAIDAKSIVKTAVALATRDYSKLTDEEFEEGISAGVNLDVVRLLQSIVPAPQVHSRPVGYRNPHLGTDALRRQVKDIETRMGFPSNRRQSRYHAAEFGEGIVVHKDGQPMPVEDILVELRRGAAKVEELA